MGGGRRRCRNGQRETLCTCFRPKTNNFETGELQITSPNSRGGDTAQCATSPAGTGITVEGAQNMGCGPNQSVWRTGKSHEYRGQSVLKIHLPQTVVVD